MIIKPPEDMSRKEKLTHIKYLLATEGQKAAIAWWVREGRGIGYKTMWDLYN